MSNDELSENRQRQLAGKLYYAFTPENIKARERCATACQQYNKHAGEVSRRERVKLWRKYVSLSPSYPWDSF